MTLSPKHPSATPSTCLGTSTTALSSPVAIFVPRSPSCFRLPALGFQLEQRDRDRHRPHRLCPDDHHRLCQKRKPTHKPKAMTSLIFSLAIFLVVVIYGIIAVALVLGAAWLFDRLILWPFLKLKAKHTKSRETQPPVQHYFPVEEMISLGAALRERNPGASS
jgi:hypothetical protein